MSSYEKFESSVQSIRDVAQCLSTLSPMFRDLSMRLDTSLEQLLEVVPTDQRWYDDADSELYA